jgi:hypothetical protein
MIEMRFKIPKLVFTGFISSSLIHIRKTEQVVEFDFGKAKRRFRDALE